MNCYHNFIGIDIGKFNFVVAIHGQKKTCEYPNTSEGILTFLSDYKPSLKEALCILETTGGYELSLLYTLCHKKIPVHRADTRKVKSFIRSHGNAAKTDALDARALARYGLERVNDLALFTPPTNNSLDLFALVQRRSDLKQTLVAEKNRRQSPSQSCIIKDSISRMLHVLEEEIGAITEQIKTLINNDPVLKQKQDILKTIPGIGVITAFELLILLPELGSLDRRAIASLAGLAPRSHDSGKFKGYRRVAPGRSGIKPSLFLAAMAARNSNSPLKTFYENLIARGKKKMVALTALMRKILVIANARLKAYQNPYQQAFQHA